MNRRAFIVTTAAAVAAAKLGFDPRSAGAQDLEFIAALERAQSARPAHLTSTARIAPETEPGDPLVVHGRAVAEDGVTLIASAVVFAYQTDRTGLYDRPGSPAHSWRLRGWALTGSSGRFEFRTIRPAPYPNRNTAAHIHTNIFLADGRRYSDGLMFDDDPLVTAADRAMACHVRHEGGVQHVDYVFRLQEKNRF
jgi:protocatechuate 3,4-dioxygenase beta subunit